MKEKYKKLKESPNGKSIIKLGFYFAFLGVVFVLLIIASAMGTSFTDTPRKESESTSKEELEVKSLTYFEKQQVLYEGEYGFTYKVDGDVTVYYTGDYNKGTVDGFKETNDELIRYRIEDGKVYSISLDSKTEYDRLYEGLDEELFDFEKLFAKLNENSVNIQGSGDDKTYNYNNLDGKNYSISTSKTGIDSIIIKDDSKTYDFSFEY